MTGPTAEETVELLRAMTAVVVHLPTMQLAIVDNSIPPEQQQAFGDQLVNLGNLVRGHAQQRGESRHSANHFADD